MTWRRPLRVQHPSGSRPGTRTARRRPAGPACGTSCWWPPPGPARRPASNLRAGSASISSAYVAQCGDLGLAGRVARRTTRGSAGRRRGAASRPAPDPRRARPRAPASRRRCPGRSGCRRSSRTTAARPGRSAAPRRRRTALELDAGLRADPSSTAEPLLASRTAEVAKASSSSQPSSSASSRRADRGPHQRVGTLRAAGRPLRRGARPGAARLLRDSCGSAGRRGGRRRRADGRCSIRHRAPRAAWPDPIGLVGSHRGRSRRGGLDFPREWIEFADPADAEHWIRADLTWLCSRWTCIFGRGCHGIVEGQAEHGCCSHGAFFSDSADEKRVTQFAAQADPPRLAVLRRRPHKKGGKLRFTEGQRRRGRDRRKHPRRRRRLHLPQPRRTSPAAGCALHALALRTGLQPAARPSPRCAGSCRCGASRSGSTARTGRGSCVSTVAEFDRRGWGEGGHDLHWYCTSLARGPRRRRAACTSRYGPELTALIGAPAYAELARLCAKRLELGLVAVHPATEGAAHASKKR